MKLPVKIQKSIDATDAHRVYIVDTNEERICSMYHKDFGEYATCIHDAEYICKAINDYQENIFLKTLNRCMNEEEKEVMKKYINKYSKIINNSKFED